jgi:hypothetical protein
MKNQKNYDDVAEKAIALFYAGLALAVLAIVTLTTFGFL